MALALRGAARAWLVPLVSSKQASCNHHWLAVGLPCGAVGSCGAPAPGPPQPVSAAAP
jgi:hypothetical protein